MFNRRIITIIIFLLGHFSNAIADEYYSTRLCESGQYDCIQTRPGESWTSLWPNATQRDLIKRFNRMNTHLRPGIYIALPDDIEMSDTMSISPLPHKIAARGSKVITVDLTLLAWGAYDNGGNLLRWGPASGGRNFCYDVNAPCKTVCGEFQIYDIRGKNCISKQYPINEGGAPMPYCMFFKEGYAIHGSDEVPGFNASHGCVRVFREDAQWINEIFVRSEGPTKVLVLPYE
jgi:L,D-transpeptidase ErfK/SrfK